MCSSISCPEMKRSFEKIGPYSVLILFFLVFYLHILDVPMNLLFRGALLCAFYGTPVWESLVSDGVGG